MINKEVTTSNYDEIYGAYIKFQRMVRTEKYKMIVYPNAKKILIFDMVNDPQEMTDLADNADYAEVKKDLVARLKKQQKLMDDQLDLHEAFPAIF